MRPIAGMTTQRTEIKEIKKVLDRGDIECPAFTPYVPYLPELLEDPFEQWLSFERHKGTGLVVLRTRVIKAIATGKLEGQLLVAQARKGQLEAWTVIPTRPGYLQNQRAGELLYGRGR